ncbi:hypothetical protein DdX_10277 [Ditylenchus destructor]|uniref:Uncharacterized protein n=1 Tax=Ditylenchus destructor TaxID=166010 RepID=A0AAD4R5Q0_9BILA|nr:hypothetical protein DdX_10277 [Ditylenchus destructor]
MIKFLLPTVAISVAIFVSSTDAAYDVPIRINGVDITGNDAKMDLEKFNSGEEVLAAIKEKYGKRPELKNGFIIRYKKAKWDFYFTYLKGDYKKAIKTIERLDIEAVIVVKYLVERQVYHYQLKTDSILDFTKSVCDKLMFGQYLRALRDSLEFHKNDLEGDLFTKDNLDGAHTVYIKDPLFIKADKLTFHTVNDV